MKILVLGSKGQLGLCLLDQFKEFKHEVNFFSKNEIDLSKIISLEKKIISMNPDIVINVAAFTAVDKAENYEKEAYLINHIAVERIARACNELGCWIIHISTDYVFDGLSKTPYKENDLTNPLSIYGKSKLKGEIAINTFTSKNIIIRTGWVYSEYGNNFMKTMLKIAKDNSEINIVGDQFGCPTYAQDIAIAIKTILSKIISNKSLAGTYHFCGNRVCNWHEFALAIFQEAKLLGYRVPIRVNSINTADYPTEALRPSYSVLECSKISKNFSIKPSNWRNGIKNALNNLKEFND